MIDDALRLWTTVAPYSGFRCETISWRLLPAIANDQLRLFYRDDECVGLITWAFMTDDEFKTRVYDGVEIFGRNDGDKMVFVDMIAPHGKNDVLWMCKEMRKQFWSQYPNVTEVFAHRGNRNGVFPNRGAWHDAA